MWVCLTGLVLEECILLGSLSKAGRGVEEWERGRGREGEGERGEEGERGRGREGEGEEKRGRGREGEESWRGREEKRERGEEGETTERRRRRRGRGEYRDKRGSNDQIGQCALSQPRRYVCTSLQ